MIRFATFPRTKQPASIHGFVVILGGTRTPGSAGMNVSAIVVCFSIVVKWKLTPLADYEKSH